MILKYISCLIVFLTDWLIIQVQCQLTFQKGSSDAFYYVGHSLNLYDSSDAGRDHTEQYKFPQIFAQKPQVFLVVTLNDYENKYPVGYELEIRSITNDGFEVYVKVQHTNRYYGIKFQWYAFDDQRRQVISAFNQQPQPTFTFDHDNPNFVQAVSSLVSFSSDDELLVGTKIESVTSTSVTVKISSNSHLTQVGFQIFIGPKEAMLIGPSMNCGKFGNSQSAAISTQWIAQEYVANIEEMGWKNDNNLRGKTQVDNVGSYVSFTAEAWSGSYFESFQLNYFFLLTQWNSGIYIPMYSYDYFQSRLVDNKNLINQKVTILELSNTYNLGQVEKVLIQNTTLDLTFEIFAKCTSNELWKIKFLQSPDCYQSYDIQCNPAQYFNSHRHITKFLQTDIVSQTITISVQPNSIQIIQHVIDQKLQDYLILDLSKI